MVVLYILLFIICLSTLVMIHEAGHLLTAKMFNVYCFEYAIGFGPKLFSKKRKKGETYFSLRAVPFGGFVSMYGEAETIPEGLVIDEKRSLLKIKKWKRAIIMLAGITMNMVLALVIFFIYEIGFPKYIAHYGHINVAKNSIAEAAGLVDGDAVYAMTSSNDSTYIYYDDSSSITIKNEMTSIETEVNCFFGYNYSSITLKNTTLNDHLVAYEAIKEGGLSDGADTISISDILLGSYLENVDYRVTGFVNAVGKYKTNIDGFEKEIFVVEVSENYSIGDQPTLLFAFENYDTYKNDFAYICKNSSITVFGKINKDLNNIFIVSAANNNYLFNVPNYYNGANLFKKNGVNVPTKITYNIYQVNDSTIGRGIKKEFIEQELTGSDSFKLKDNPGISMQLSSYRTNYVESVKNTFIDFADSATIIGKSLAQLLTNAESWKDVGGIIAIGVVTTKTLTESGFGPFLYYWALISVNLAIVNLLPFPGLDGWHFLVTVIEGVTRKEIPTKFKTIMSAIGLIILFAFMILIVIKDVITFI